jgi:membrane fusion protein (multidrug efflux system)
MTKKSVLWISIVIAIVAALAIPKLLPALSEKGPGTSAASGAKAKPKVPVGALVLRPIDYQERISIPGSMLASEQVEIKSETSGRIIGLYVKEGGTVSKGQLLVKINDADLQAQLQKAAATLRLASIKENRTRDLLVKGLVSQEEYDAISAQLQSNMADSALLAAQIAKTDIRAPFAGRVGLKNISPGEYLSSGSSIISIVAERPLKVEFSLAEKYFSRINVGDTLALSVDGSIKQYHATVFAKEPAIDEATRTVRVRAVCLDPDNSLAPGTYVQVSAVLGNRPATLMVPTQALVPDIAGWKVFVISKASAMPRPVITGVRDSAQVEILSGLTAGDTIITAGVAMLRPGSLVDIGKIE